MSVPKCQHYVPRFIIKAWANARGQVRLWKRVPSGTLINRFTSPKTVMNRAALYDLLHVPADQVAALERDFQRLESDAAPIYRKLVGRDDLAEQEMRVWSHFVLAQMARLPKHVDGAAQRASRQIAEWDEPDPEFEALKGDSPHRTVREYLDDRDPAILANLHLRVLARVMTQDVLVSRLSQMTWAVRYGVSPPLLLGDDPVLRIGDLRSGNYELIMPLSPTTALQITSMQHRADWFRNEAPKWLAFTTNDLVVRQASAEVVGEAEARFFEKRLRRDRL
jgi:hypothetical protein